MKGFFISRLSYPHSYAQCRVAFMLSAKELISTSDQRVQRVDSLMACGKSGLLFCQSHAVLTPIPRMSETCLTEMKPSLEIIYLPPSKTVKAEASYVCVCNVRADPRVGRHHERTLTEKDKFYKVLAEDDFCATT